MAIGANAGDALMHARSASLSISGVMWYGSSGGGRNVIGK